MPAETTYGGTAEATIRSGTVTIWIDNEDTTATGPAVVIDALVKLPAPRFPITDDLKAALRALVDHWNRADEGDGH